MSYDCVNRILCHFVLPSLWIYPPYSTMSRHTIPLLVLQWPSDLGLLSGVSPDTPCSLTVTGYIPLYLLLILLHCSLKSLLRGRSFDIDLCLLRPCPHVPKWSFSPTSSLASFQECLHPNRFIENDSTCCSSYFRTIGGIWNSPKTEENRRSMCNMLLHCIQTDSRRRTRTKIEEDENG